jgi:hypothetical protein
MCRTGLGLEWLLGALAGCLFALSIHVHVRVFFDRTRQERAYIRHPDVP